MPFTISHVAFVLPLRRTKFGLPLCGLAAGAIAPDLEKILTGYPERMIADGLVAMMVLDVALALALLAGASLAAPGLATLLPPRLGHLRNRMARWRAPLWPLPSLLGLTAAVIVGAASHVLIDGFSHSGTFPASEIPALADPVPGLGVPGAAFVQLGLSALGAAILFVGARRWLRDAGVRPIDFVTGWTSAQIAGLTLALGAVIGLTLLNQFAHGQLSAGGLSVVVGILGGLRAVIVVTITAGILLRPRGGRRIERTEPGTTVVTSGQHS